MSEPTPQAEQRENAGEGGRSAVASIAQGLVAPVAYVGARGLAILDHIGAIGGLTFETLRWIARAFTRRRVRMGLPAIMSQIVRVGVRSLFIVSLVSGCVGLILVLQMAPPLDQFGRKELVANIVGVAILRELGPLIAAIVLTGFAGAAIAAELGTMVVGEEIEALEAQALNPIRFLVVPRVVATVLSMMCLAVAGNVVAIGCGMVIGLLALEIPIATFWENLLYQAKAIDFITGFAKSVVFGALIGLIACTNGLRVTGGAAGVGKATTDTVVQSIVAIVIADLIFTAVFFAWKLT